MPESPRSTRSRANGRGQRPAPTQASVAVSRRHADRHDPSVERVDAARPDVALPSAPPASAEAPLADRSTANVPLADLPFDQFNRHTLVTRAIDALRGDYAEQLAILDVGGYPCLSRHFLPRDRVTVVDVLTGPDATPPFVVADGAALPFADDTFDVVISLDALEHIPRPNRRAFVLELTRVARRYVLLTAPFGRPEVKLAEELLFEFILATLKARHDQLTEHLEFQLPTVAEIEATLDEAGLVFARLPSGNVYNWLAMMLAKHHIMAIPGGETLHATLDRFYNANFFEHDQCEPAYRQLWLVATGGDPTPMQSFVANQIAPALSDAASARRLESVNLLLRLLDLKLANHEDKRLRDQIDAREANIRQLEQARFELTELLESTRDEVRARDGHIRNLQATIATLQSHLELANSASAARLRDNERLNREMKLTWLREQEFQENIATERANFARREREIAAALDQARNELIPLEREIVDLRRQIAELQNHLHQVQSGRMMRIINTLQGRDFID